MAKKNENVEEPEAEQQAEEKSNVCGVIGLLVCVIMIIFVFLIGCLLFELQFNTKPINEDCINWGYESAYHSNRGWFCFKEINGKGQSINYLDLKRQAESKGSVD